MNTYARQFNNKKTLKLIVNIFLLGILFLNASSVFAQQNLSVAENRFNAAENFVKTGVVENERSASFRYVALRGSDDVNIQFYLTTALALAAGFDETTASSIGLYDQYIDDNPKTSPVKPFNFNARRDYHFTSEKRRAKLWQIFAGAPNTANLGVFMHAKQDSYFHAGFNYIIGHLYKGVHPDQTWRPENTAKVREAAKATFETMLAAAPLLGAFDKPLSYLDIEPQTIDFLNAADDSTRGIKFALLVGRITALRGRKTEDSQPVLREIFQAIKNYSYSPKYWRDNTSQLAVGNKK